MSAHVELDRLRDFAHGMTRGVEGDSVLDHCWSCKECGDRLAVMLALVDMSVHERTQRTRRRGLIAASIAAALLAGFVWRAALLTGNPSAPPPPVEPDRASDELARLATEAPPSRDLVGFLFDFPGAIEPPQVSTSNYVTAERNGLEQIVDGRYADAVTTFQGLIASHPEDPALAAYLGVARYLDGETNDEVALLLRRGTGSDYEVLANTSAWYLANHYLRVGDRAQAEAVLRELGKQEDESGRAAVRLLRRLQEDGES